MTNIKGIDNAGHEGLTFSEKRSPERFCVGLRGRATFEVEGQAVERKVLSRDISAYGAYLLANTCPEIGDDVEVYLDEPADPKQPEIILGAVGTILRVDKLSERGYGFAVKFDAITA